MKRNKMHNLITAGRISYFRGSRSLCRKACLISAARDPCSFCGSRSLTSDTPPSAIAQRMETFMLPADWEL